MKEDNLLDPSRWRTAAGILVSGERDSLPACFRTASRALHELTRYRFTGVGRLNGGPRSGIVDVLDVWDAERFIGPITYPVAETPCYNVYNETAEVCEYENVVDLFPNDALLQEMGAHLYKGTTIKGRDSKIVGHIFAVHDRPDDPAPPSFEMLRLVADWCAREIQYHEQIQQLTESEIFIRKIHEFSEKENQLLRHSIDKIPDGVALWDQDNCLIYWNSSFQELNFQISDLLKKGVSFDYLVRQGVNRRAFELEKDPAEVVRQRILDFERGGAFEHHLSNGEWVGGNDFRLPNGGALSYRTKVTRRKIAELKLKDALDVADESNRAKSTFLAKMSHELRTPLNAIIGFSRMIQEDAEEEGLPDLVDPISRINRAGHHLLALINDILDISKIEAGALELVYEVKSADTLLRDIVSLAEPLAGQNRNTFQVDIEPDLGQIEIDATRFRQVVLNIISNACKFTNDGTVTLSAERRPDYSGDAIVVRVTDTGIGIRPEDLGSIFDEFSQADSTIHQKFGGTGLGLSITRKLLAMMGGDIAVESEFGAGTEFVLTVPVSRSRDTPVLRAEAGDDRPLSSSGGPHLLIIEDDSNARKLLGGQLDRNEETVVVAETAREGLRLARAISPRIIFLDIRLPDISGWDVLAILRADPTLRDVPVVVVTVEEDRDRAMKLGAFGYLNKPVDPAELKAIIAQLPA